MEGVDFEEMSDKDKEANESDGEEKLEDGSKNSPFVENKVFVGERGELAHNQNFMRFLIKVI